MENNENKHNPKQKHFSLEQAGNWLKEKRKNIKDAIHKEASEQQVTTAPEGDRIRYLQYCISLLTEVDADLMWRLPDNIRVSYSQREMAAFFRVFLGMKIRGCSDAYLAKKFGVPINAIKNLDVIAQEAAWRMIKRVRGEGVPLVGGT